MIFAGTRNGVVLVIRTGSRIVPSLRDETEWDISDVLIYYASTTVAIDLKARASASRAAFLQAAGLVL